MKPLIEAGAVQVTAKGVVSAEYGMLEFLTPVAEIPLTKLMQAECYAYNRWRDGYQNNWNQYFDPIAVRFSIAEKQPRAK